MAAAAAAPAPEGPGPKVEDFETLLRRTTLLKNFAVKNNYDVEPKTLKELSDLTARVTGKHEGLPNSEDHTKLDMILADLTAVTYPTTIDSLSEQSESASYRHFKRLLLYISAIALAGAITGFTLSVKPLFGPELFNSMLALCLGLLGAVVYSFFAVLRVVPAQAFNPQDEYANYARLVLGLLLGWIFYFAFARDTFAHLATVNRTEVLLVLLPFVAGYSTRFVVGVLERAMVALETGLGINERRDANTRLNRRKR